MVCCLIEMRVRPPERPLAEKGLRAHYSHYGELVWHCILRKIQASSHMFLPLRRSADKWRAQFDLSSRIRILEAQRKIEPGKREYMSIELMWAKSRSENNPQLMNCAQVVQHDQPLWLEFSICPSIHLPTHSQSYPVIHPPTQLHICPFFYQPPQLNHHSFIYPFIYPSNHSFKYPSILYPIVVIYLSTAHSLFHLPNFLSFTDRVI